MKGKRSVILIISTLCIICFSFGLFSWLKTEVTKKENQLASLNSQYEEISKENDEIEYLINDADDQELYEYLARERGYVYPDEKIYYDVTPGN